MENQRSTSTIDRSRGASLVPWESLEDHAPNAFTVAWAPLPVSLFVPMGLSVIIDRAWLGGIALAGFAALTAALGLIGVHPRVSADAPRLAAAGTAFATIAGVVGLVVLGLTGLTGAAIHLPT